VSRACALLLAALTLVGCGGDARGDDEPLTVFAAASLTEVFTDLSPDMRFNFAGSDALATQLREGARADVYAAASPRYPDELHDEGLVEEPRVFATNELALIVPLGNPAGIETLADAARPGTRVVIGARGVPIGDYTRMLLVRAGRTDVLERVASEEEDVKGVVGKVALGEADAGFVYVTDAGAAEDVETVALPEAAQQRISYPVAVVAGSDQPDEARRFVELLLSEPARLLLLEAGFGLP
jgi:molybdate transport system substrate-binding protein